MITLQKVATSLPGVWEFRPDVFRDSRGFFLETYRQSWFSELGITDIFVQDNQSFSIQGTLRGLHYQLRHPQAKICRVVEGSALDVAVDVRFGSPTFGKWASVILSASQLNEIYVPPGFAHGFLALSEKVQFLYKCSDFYDAADERGILWSDPDLGIHWGNSNPIISEKDARLPRLSELQRNLLPQYHAK